VFGRRRAASGEALLAAVQALGAPVRRPSDIRGALIERKRLLTGRLAPPVAVAWGQRATRLDLRVPPERTGGEVRCRLTLEGGEIREWTTPLDRCADAGTETAEGMRRVVKRLVVPGPIPFGYHRLHLAIGLADVVAGETLLISAPTEAPGKGRARHSGESPSREGGHERHPRDWGAFLPLYALRSERSWGIGDLTDLRALLDWIRSLGGGLAATLPFFAAFYDEPFDPSPYAPASRLFWNEIYIDVARVPELEASPEARELVGSAAVASELAELRASPTVEYQRAMGLKRRVLELLSRSIGERRRRDFDAFVASDPLVDDYARFRAACERLGRPWTDWPQAQHEGTLSSADIDESGYHYHRYAQWIVHEQLEALADKGGSGPLYLDLPIGVSPAGFDVWRERSCFVPEASAGSPPDAMFTSGQNWGFPPMHPDGIRATGYRYQAQCFRRMLRYAGLLRIDHVMGLHRLFMIPPGVDATQGTYVRYPAEELYAVLVLEAHRAGSLVLGEDLGTVPGYVRTSMDRRNIQHSYVVEYELAGEEKLHPAGRHDVATLNTHDMAMFAAFWSGADIDDRVELGLTDAKTAAAERERRTEIRHDLVALLRGEGLLGFEESPGAAQILRGCLAYLARSEAPLVVVNLEDLWLEEEPQNIPGTMHERPNWRRKARLSLEDMRSSSDVLALLEDVNRRRQRTAE
jgi:4-alpha-glucanotransferase